VTSLPSQKVILTVTDADLPYCRSNCLATGGVAKSIPAMVKTNFPNVADSNFQLSLNPILDMVSTCTIMPLVLTMSSTSS